MKRILFYLVVLLGLGVLTLFKPVIMGQAGYYGGMDGDEQQIKRVIEKAIGSLDYTRAQDRGELERILREIYSGPALVTVNEAIWDQWQTDNVNPASILRWTEFQVEGDRARVRAALYFRDWTDNAELYGQGYWQLIRTEAGWRIVDFEYEWG